MVNGYTLYTLVDTPRQNLHCKLVMIFWKCIFSARLIFRRAAGADGLDWCKILQLINGKFPRHRGIARINIFDRQK